MPNKNTLIWLMAPQLVIIFMMSTAITAITETQVFLVWLMVMITIASFLHWRRKNDGSFPFLTVLAAIHVLNYCPALFWNPWTSPSELEGHPALPDTVMTESLALGLVSLSMITLGMNMPLFGGIRRRFVTDVSDSPMALHLVRAYTFIGIIFNVFGLPAYVLGSDGRNAVFVLGQSVPLAAFLFLLQRSLRERVSAGDRIIVILFLLTRILDGMREGVLTSSAMVVFLSGVTYFGVRRRIPWRIAALTVVLVLFLQVGKNEFRNKYWNQQVESSLIERTLFWVSSSWSQWDRWLVTGDSALFRELTAKTSGRASVLTVSAVVLDKTPDVVPYQNGMTYQYMLVTLIPRFLWADKPSASDANQFYQVAYGLTRQENLHGVSIACGFEAEAYMNFGWYGVLSVTFVVGLVFNLLQRWCFSAQSGQFFQVLGLSLLPGLVILESQIAMYLGPLVQAFAATYIMFLPILQRRRTLDPSIDSSDRFELAVTSDETVSVT